jgi:hypothetical protein
MTTQRQFAVNILAAFLITGTLLAQEFWDRKQYLQWTNDEISRLTSNSPWAKEANVESGGRNITLRITWLTALPIKQAFLKERIDEGGVLAESAKEIMTVEENYYAIGITGLPADMAQKLTEASLRIANKPEIQPAKGDFQSRGRTVDVMVLFARTSPITADDKEVEVVLKLGDAEVGAKFPLKDMVYNGKLEL